MAIVRNIVVRIGADIGELQRALGNAQSQLGKFGSAMTNIGSKMTLGITLPIAGIGIAAIKTAADFEQGMSNIKAVSGATGDEMSKLRDLALKMGADTKYSAKEAASGIEELIKAGVSTEQILNGGLQGALSLAAAGELELADAAEIASTALNAFKKDNLSVQNAADILAGAANASATSVQEMKYSLAAVSAVASSVGMSFKDTSTAIAVFAQNGLKGSDAGTSLKTMLMNLQPSTDKQIKTFKQLGLLTDKGTSKFYNQKGQLKSLTEISSELRNSMDDMTDAQRMQAMEIMFGSDAIRAANILYAEGAEGVNKMQTEMGKVTATQVATEKMNNFNGSLEQLKGSLETLGIQLGTLFLPYLKKAADALTGLVNNFMTLDPNIQKAVVVFALIAAAIGPVLMALGMMASGASVVSGALSAIGTALATISAPVLIVIAAIGLLVASFIYLWNTNEEFRTNMTAIWESIKTSLFAIWDNIVIIAKAVWDGLKLFWSVWGDDVMAYFKIIWEEIGGVLDGAFKIIKGIFEVYAGLFTGDWSRVWTGIKDILAGAWQMIWSQIDAALKGIQLILSIVWKFIKDNILAPVYNWLVNTFGPVFEVLRQVFGVALGLILIAIETTWNYIKDNVLIPVYNWINNTLSIIWDNVKKIFGPALSGIQNSISETWNYIKDNILKPVYNWLNETLKPIFDIIKNALNDAWNGLTDTVKNIWNGITTTIKTGINTIIGLVNGFIKKINSISVSIPSMDVPGFGKVGGYSLSFPKIPEIAALATGGIVNDPTMALVGEAGPEAVIPLSKLDSIANNRPITIYLDGKKIYEGIDNYLGSHLVGLGGV